MRFAFGECVKDEAAAVPKQIRKADDRPLGVDMIGSGKQSITFPRAVIKMPTHHREKLTAASTVAEMVTEEILGMVKIIIARR
jgi:hypothetical protein